MRALNRLLSCSINSGHHQQHGQYFMLEEVRRYLGISSTTLSLKEIISAATTAMLAIFCVIYLSEFMITHMEHHEIITKNTFVLISIAASSVLLFAVPHGALSQPWPVLGGHITCAFVGVVCFKLFDASMVAAVLSVTLSILLMLILRCIHPPGGATALAAVLGGDAIHELGFTYILFPTLLNCVIILIAAVIVNYPLKWRRYPAHLFYKSNHLKTFSPGDRKNEITTEDFLSAINEHASYIDITEEGWMDIFERAKQHAETSNEHPSDFRVHATYSNGKLGQQWQIRQVMELSKRNKVHFKITAGNHSGSHGTCSIKELLKWAKFEVFKNSDGSWERTTQEQ